MELSDFDYDLPKEFIAQAPAKPRDSSKLLVVGGEKMEAKRFSDILGFIQEGDVIVINTSKVSYSKLVGKKETGSPAVVILSKEDEGIYTCKIKTKNPHVGCRLMFDKGVEAEIIAEVGEDFLIRFTKNEVELKNILELPLPPYITSDVKDEDYQTVYSKEEGSVAAPTAGLHFTPSLIKRITQKGAIFAHVCLHVGFGTFIGVKTSDPRDHKMDSEWFTIDRPNADIINNRKGRLFVVGTTSFRCLESAASDSGFIKYGSMETNLFIYPGYNFKIKPDFFITNFHLPKTTLLMLVSAMAGRENILAAYEYAKNHNFRFYSLGDAMMIVNNN